jgi:hypothetical protein
LELPLLSLSCAALFGLFIPLYGAENVRPSWREYDFAHGDSIESFGHSAALSIESGDRIALRSSILSMTGPLQSGNPDYRRITGVSMYPADGIKRQ